MKFAKISAPTVIILVRINLLVNMMGTDFPTDSSCVLSSSSSPSQNGGPHQESESFAILKKKFKKLMNICYNDSK